MGQEFELCLGAIDSFDGHRLLPVGVFNLISSPGLIDLSTSRLSATYYVAPLFCQHFQLFKLLLQKLQDISNIMQSQLILSMLLLFAIALATPHEKDEDTHTNVLYTSCSKYPFVTPYKPILTQDANYRILNQMASGKEVKLPKSGSLISSRAPVSLMLPKRQKFRLSPVYLFGNPPYQPTSRR